MALRVYQPCSLACLAPGTPALAHLGLYVMTDTGNKAKMDHITQLPGTVHTEETGKGYTVE